MTDLHNGEQVEGIPPKFGHTWKYFPGPNGLGGFTIQPDKDGWFYSFYCKPVGRGARKGEAKKFQYIERMTSKRRRRLAAENRSYNLAHGLAITDGVKKQKKSEGNPPGAGYCMSEKKQVIMKDLKQVRSKSGRKMIRGTCPDCSQVIHKFGNLIECPECGQTREIASNDYICKACRTSN